MLGKLHQGTLELFLHDPWLAFDILGLERPVVGDPIDRRGEVERDHPTHEGAVKVDYPDLLLVCKDAEGGIVICVEAQGAFDRGKRWSLPYYQAAVAKDHELQTWLVVVSYCDRMSAALAVWKVGPPPAVHALVLDVSNVPRIIDPEQARIRPTATVLSAALHGSRGDLEAARVGIQATLELPKKRRDSYIGTILAAVPKKHKATLMGELKMQERKEIWAIERRSGTFLMGREEGWEAGRRTTLIELIFTLLEIRAIPLDTDTEAQIRSCDDLTTVERWARLVREVERASQLFEQPEARPQTSR